MRDIDFSFKVYFIYFKTELQSRGDRERELSHPLVHSPNAHNKRLGQAKAWSFIHVSSVGGGIPAFGPFSAAVPGTIAGSEGGKHRCLHVMLALQSVA